MRLGLALDGEVLAIQGPPGSGKTTAAVQLIRALLDAGKKVGVTATSHAVIGNLLKAVGRPALHKFDESPTLRFGRGGVVRPTTPSSRCAARRRREPGRGDGVVLDPGGRGARPSTCWWSTRPGSSRWPTPSRWRGRAIDGAAGRPAAAGPAEPGDPPYAAGISALEHLLGDHATIPPDRGIFLDRTYRMHPDLTAFVSDLAYEGRLDSAPDRERHGDRG